MSFIAFKISDYDHTAEREQYRKICQILRSKFEQSKEMCLFIANYNIFDCEFDGIIIKSDAIISVEFKNYGGNVLAVENGEWTLSDGTIIKGGSRKSVYQQAKVNHIAIKRGLTEGGILPQRMIRDIPTLIVFSQPICLQDKLGVRVKSWLHICDMEHFIEKVEDITTVNFNLSNEQIIELIPKLGLIEEFVDPRFSVNIELFSKKDFNGKFDIDNSLDDINECLFNIKNLSAVNLKTDNVKESYQTFISTRVLPSIGIVNNDYELIVVSSEKYGQVIDIPLPFRAEYVVILQIKDASNYSVLLRSLFGKKVVSLANDVICWGEGEFVYVPSEMIKETDKSGTSSETKFSKKTNFNFRLPKWLDDCIFKELQAKYLPDYARFSYNLNLNKNECKIYLGTYFPRSYAEGYLIFDALLRDKSIVAPLIAKNTVKILDFGCGSAGEIFGFLQAIEIHLPQNITIQVVGVDGNHNSLRLFEDIAKRYNNLNKNNLKIHIAPCYIESQSDIETISSIIGSQFDFIITSKAIGEFERKKRLPQNGYEFFAELFSPLLADNGIMSIVDVTIKDETSNLFLSQKMNLGVNRFLSNHPFEFKSLAPCSGLSKEGYCNHSCFYMNEITISHSKRFNDISKFAFRIIARYGLQNECSIFNRVLNNINCIHV